MADVRHFIVATAGHVDHGKSALVKALTGTDPDRLPEEKARGITIDLGFAALDLPAPSGGDFAIGIVDVPGHEAFVKNMVAGVGAADAALLIVAADDGWMPQTEEHVQVLTYFGIRRAVVALTKADLARDVNPAADAVRHQLLGTPFAQADVVPTSVLDGRGLEALQQALARLLAGTPPSPDIGKPRLPIDRIFTLPGIGTVVTGTLQGGALHKGQHVVLQPAGKATRIRRLQTHNRDVDSSGPGQRTALNLPDLSADDVHRGDVVTLDAHGGPASIVDVLIEISGRAGRGLRNGARVRAHYGSGNVGAQVALLEDRELAPGGRGLAQLRLERPVFVFEGDRFTVRDWAEQATLAGGLVLDADANRRALRSAARRHYLSRRAEAPGDAAAWVESLLGRDVFVPRAHLLMKSGFSEAAIEGAVGHLVATGVAAVAGPALCLAATWERLRETAVEAIGEYHRAHPDHPGLPLTDLRVGLGLTGAASPAFDALVAHVCSGGIVKDGNVVRWATHLPALPPALESAGSILRARLSAKPFDPPSRSTLAPDALSLRALRFLVQIGEAVEVSTDIVLTAENVVLAREAVVGVIRERGAATLADVRDRLGCSRRVLVPLLEYFDRTGVTVRQGDRRTLR